MSHQAKITCDWRSCSQYAVFAPEQRPPRNWWLVTHPMAVVRSGGTTTEQRLSTFCTAEHVAAWAAEIAKEGDRP